MENGLKEVKDGRKMRESEGIRGCVNITVRYVKAQYSTLHPITHRWVEEDEIFSMQQS